VVESLPNDSNSKSSHRSWCGSVPRQGKGVPMGKAFALIFLKPTPKRKGGKKTIKIDTLLRNSNLRVPPRMKKKDTTKK